MNYQQIVKTQKKKKIILWCVVLACTALAVTLIILVIRCPRRQYVTRVFVSEARVIDKQTDTDSSPTKPYVKLSLVNSPVSGVTLDEDSSWVNVSSDYYSHRNIGDIIGVLVGNYDIYKDRFFGIIPNAGQTFEKNVWGIEDIFDTIDAANDTYPHRSFTDNAILNSKAAANNTHYFVLTYEDREMTAEVSEDEFNQYNENDSVPCDFDGYGDFLKVTGIH